MYVNQQPIGLFDLYSIAGAQRQSKSPDRHRAHIIVGYIKIIFYMKKPVIGLGTGRCGTTSLARFLSAQPNSLVSHELENDPDIRGYPPSWNDEWWRIYDALKRMEKQSPDVDFIGDVALFYLKYIPQIIEHFPNVVFIGLKRNREKVVKSFIFKVAGRDCWRKFTGNIWDRVFPKYPDEPTVEDSIRRYWNEYYDELEHYRAQYPERFIIVPTQNLNSKLGMHAILDHIKYPRNNSRVVSAVFHENGNNYGSYFVVLCKTTTRRFIGDFLYEFGRKVFYKSIYTKKQLTALFK